MAVCEVKSINGIYIKIIRSKRKTAAIEVDREGEVIFRSPLRLSEKQIIAFVTEKQGWIEKAVQRQKEKPTIDISNEEMAALKIKAKEIIPKKVQYYSSLMGLTPSSVKINSAKTRFGSGSAKGSLNFSARLMRYPEKAIDYVVVHELAHIKHHNHSKSFYSLIERYMPDYKERIKMLKR